MKLRTYDLEKGEGRRIPPPGECIYCRRVPIPPGKLTDEHVLPFAIAANTTIFQKASCEECARTIHPYEEDVLLRQLGTFRRQIDAPSRTKRKKRPTHANISFKEVDDQGGDMRPLGQRRIAIADLPLALSLWQLPEPRIINPNAAPGEDVGQPWYHCMDEEKVRKLCRQVAEETGSRNVAMEIGAVNRTNFMRFLAKTAHAYAMAEQGLDAFLPMLPDLILNRKHDLAQYVGGYYGPRPPGGSPENLVNAHIGQPTEGPGRGLVTVALQFYPLLDTPIYSVVVGRTLIDMDAHPYDIGYDVSG